jgi:hypothetical protein
MNRLVEKSFKQRLRAALLFWGLPWLVLLTTLWQMGPKSRDLTFLLYVVPGVLLSSLAAAVAEHVYYRVLRPRVLHWLKKSPE